MLSIRSRWVKIAQKKFLRLFFILILSCFIAYGITACTSSQFPWSTSGNGTPIAVTGTLATVLNRGKVICGVNGQLPGFSFQSPDGTYSGLDADYCRAIASALFNDPSRAEFRRVSSDEQFQTLTQSQEIDILLRDVAWTIQRDSQLAIDFAPPIFYDGQSLLTKADPTLNSPENLRDQTFCVQDGAAANSLQVFFRKVKIPIQPILLEDDRQVFINFANGNCQVAVAHRSTLAIQRQTLTNPEQYQISTLTLTQEPLSPVIREQDPRWADAVRWIIYGTFRAEELGISQNNVMALSPSSDLEIRRFLGEEGRVGADLGIPNDFMKRVIRWVGNYGEIYQRNIGDPFQLPRGVNQLWLKGGLIYPMPFW
ncbi:MAG: transporter substrate-binding domain-containing protein [Oculatellaceae cyanobacterium Prado106]|jgi:general L-amino acid transport system substrate-binding protein|nr:transporter substrate-binding domain-containing protein [Oculatellaceae cyanobacterium Prado106]